MVGIVAEGATDVVVIEEYLSAWLGRQHDPIGLEVRPVQPLLDATSGQFGDGGWTLVKAWCEDNSAAIRALGLFSQLFEGDQPLDILIVQLDGDRINEYTEIYPDIAVPDNADAGVRGTIIEAVLERWLWGSVQQRAADVNQGRHCLVASIRALEAWLIAGLDPSIPNPEEIEDPEMELMRVEPGLDTKAVGGVTRLKKNVLAWQELAQRSRGALPHIYTACPHFGTFLDYVDAVIELRR